MEPIIYRNIEEKDHPQISGMLCGVWRFDRYIADAATAARAGESFFMSYLARQNYAEVAARGGEILGVLLGHLKSMPFPKEHKKWEAEARRRLFFFNHSKEGKRFCEAQKRTAKFEAALLGPHEDRFDAELVLFASAPAARGQGVGKALLSRYNTFLKEHGAKKAFLLTDSFCNFGFYDHLGYERIAQTEGFLGIERDGKPFEFYLYGYDV